MSESFKLDINISQKKVEEMAKQVIREIIESKIQEAMNNINVDKIISDKVNNIDNKLSQVTTQVTKDILKKRLDDIIWQTRGELHNTIKVIVLEEIQKKPLTGNVYLKIDNTNIETDYDYDD